MPRRHPVWSLSIILALMTGAASQAQTPDATALVQATEQTTAQAALRTAVQRWLQQLDAGDHLASWSSAATPFKNAVTSTQWQQAAQSVRQPLGAVQSRQDKSTQFTRSLPGAPDGQYAVLQFDTRFDRKAQAVETLTLVLEADGAWRVTGYFIR
jgi:Protein of unknown function (DUF4019)